MGTRGAGIVLIGLRRSGKSLVGAALAQELGGRFSDLDAVVAEKVGSSVGEYLAQYGEPAFRIEESEGLQSALTQEEACRKADDPGSVSVLATGGGTPTISENRELLRRWGRVVYLHASQAELVARSRDESVEQRPLLTGETVEAETQELMRLRNPLYSCFADVVVSADDGVARVVARCRRALGLI